MQLAGILGKSRHPASADRDLSVTSSRKHTNKAIQPILLQHLHASAQLGLCGVNSNGVTQM